MGITYSCLFTQHIDSQTSLESVNAKSNCFVDDDNESITREHQRPINCFIHDLKLAYAHDEKMIVERSVSLKEHDLNKMVSLIKSSSLLQSEKDTKILLVDRSLESDTCSFDAEEIQKHEAAVKLQKVYKSFRTRRKLADCAVLAEQSWWELLDFAELEHSSVSFFDLEKHESAISRWSRARTRAAKVGKGLSKNNKAQKLALQHWLEAIDPRHRYGHNLHFYYKRWLDSKSIEPFFYWLDVGEGKEVNLEKCPRSKLQQQCVKYLGPMERKHYEVVLEDGKFVYKETGEFVHTTEDAKWIFVLSTSKNLYVGKKKKGSFQHSSFLAGGAALAAGRLIVQSGILKAAWPHSGHYQPTEENFKDFLTFLGENNVDLRDVKTTPADEEEDSSSKQSSNHNRTNSFDENLSRMLNDLLAESINVQDFVSESRNSVALDQQKPDCNGSGNEGLTEQWGPAMKEENLRDEEHEVENIPEEVILQRIDSKKGSVCYQLGKQLSRKWTTGAGPRIGCVRDYPSGIQFCALEKMNLSPRSILHSRSTNS